MSATSTAAPDRRVAPIARFLAWWGATLTSLLPARLRAGSTIDVAVDGDALVLRRPGAAPRRLPPAPRGEERIAVEPRDAEVVLRLSPAGALSQQLTLPQAAERELGQVIGHEIDRRTPFRAPQVYADARIVGRDRSARTISVALTVVPKSVVDPLVGRLEAIGLKPATVRLADGRALPVPGLARPPRGIGALNLALLALLAVLCLAALLGPSWRAGAELERLHGEIARLQPQVEEVLRLRDSLRLGEAATAAAVAAKAAAPSPVQLLEELTRRLPDDTWLSQLNLVDGRLEIEGSTGSAAALVGLLEASPRFAAVAFRAPVTADPITKRESFQFRITLARP
jgi:general secretion pathway protein L